MPEALIITGGRPLRGTVPAGGSKNGALPMLAAALLVRGRSRLENVPQVRDVAVMLDLIRSVGYTVEQSGGTVTITGDTPAHSEPDPALVEQMRASFYLAAPLIARLGAARICYPGGCRIGSRPVDYITDTLAALGATVEADAACVHLRAARLRGGTITLDPTYRSPGASFTAVMAAALADGVTTIENASLEPEMVAFCDFLNAAGARISGAGTPTVRVEGVRALHDAEGVVPPDRLEAGTLLLAGAATRGEVTVTGIPGSSLEALLAALRTAGATVRADAHGVTVALGARAKPADIETGPYPAYPTDLQPQFGVVQALADGVSRAVEAIYDGRLAHWDQLVAMGARVTVGERTAVITGVPELHAAGLVAENIRAGAALLLAALAAKGTSRLAGYSVIARGYDRIEEKLRTLGADITANEPARTGSGVA